MPDAYHKIRYDVADGSRDDHAGRSRDAQLALPAAPGGAAGGAAERARGRCRPLRRARLLAREGLLVGRQPRRLRRRCAPDRPHYDTQRFVEIFKALGELGKPSIVAANGHVLAGSLGIALACDLIIAKEGAGFGTPEINVGLFPFMIMALIYRNVPRKKTNEMLLLGERLTAEEALAAGIVNKVVPAEEFDAAVEDWATKLASKSPVVMRLGKDAMCAPAWTCRCTRRSTTCARSSRSSSAPRTRSRACSAFFEKREPEWKGR